MTQVLYSSLDTYIPIEEKRGIPGPLCCRKGEGRVARRPEILRIIRGL